MVFETHRNNFFPNLHGAREAKIVSREWDGRGLALSPVAGGSGEPSRRQGWAELGQTAWTDSQHHLLPPSTHRGRPCPQQQGEVLQPSQPPRSAAFPAETQPFAAWSAAVKHLEPVHLLAGHKLRQHREQAADTAQHAAPGWAALRADWRGCWQEEGKLTQSAQRPTALRPH